METRNHNEACALVLLTKERLKRGSTLAEAFRQLPQQWSDKQAKHKYTDARWTKKHDRYF